MTMRGSEPGAECRVEDIAPAEFARRCASDQRWQLIDVREQWEIGIASLGDAIPIPMTEISVRHCELDKTQPVAVICHSGVRSSRVAAFLLAQGFPEVANIAGGIDAWSQDLDTTVPRY